MRSAVKNSRRGGESSTFREAPAREGVLRHHVPRLGGSGFGPSGSCLHPKPRNERIRLILAIFWRSGGSLLCAPEAKLPPKPAAGAAGGPFPPPEAENFTI